MNILPPALAFAPGLAPVAGTEPRSGDAGQLLPGGPTRTILRSMTLPVLLAH